MSEMPETRRMQIALQCVHRGMPLPSDIRWQLTSEQRTILTQAIEDAEQRLVTQLLTGLYFPTVAQKREDKTQETGGEEMRRFLLTYTRGECSIVIEGVQFSDGVIVLELYPDDDWHGTREFRTLAHMEYHINEFGESALQWIDEMKNEPL